jgi:hypothetical protein
VIKTKFVTHVEVKDPDTQQPIIIEIRKLETGPMVGYVSLQPLFVRYDQAVWHRVLHPKTD